MPISVVYGDSPFLRGPVSEQGHGKRRMVTAITLALSMAFAYSAAPVLRLGKPSSLVPSSLIGVMPARARA